MSQRIETPFDTIEEAQEYIRLLSKVAAEAKRDIDNDIILATNRTSQRRLQALRIVAYNLEKLLRNLSASGRILNDLRSLRRLLFEEKPVTSDKKHHQVPITSTVPAFEPLHVEEILGNHPPG